MTITINLMGRLGNQLFQYAVLRNLSLLKGFDLHIKTNLSWHGQPPLLSFFNIQNGNPPNNTIYTYSQPNGSYYYDENILNINDNTMLVGHFENIEYFKENKEIIQNELTIKDENIINLTNNYIHEITNNGSSKLVSIHFRRGDVVFLENNPHEYYENQKRFVLESLETIKKKENNIVLLIFTGGVNNEHNNANDQFSNDIEWVNNFILENKSDYIMRISPGTINSNDLMDYCLLSQSDYIISPRQSTFSFMAYFVNKKIIEYFSLTNWYGKK